MFTELGLAFADSAVESMVRKAGAKPGLRSTLGLFSTRGHVRLSLPDIVSTHFTSHHGRQNSLRVFFTVNATPGTLFKTDNRTPYVIHLQNGHRDSTYHLGWL